MPFAAAGDIVSNKVQAASTVYDAVKGPAEDAARGFLGLPDRDRNPTTATPPVAAGIVNPPPAAAPAAPPQLGMAAGAKPPTSPVAVTPAPIPAAAGAPVPGTITRVGNSYSGTDVAAGAPIANARNPVSGVTVLPGAAGVGGFSPSGDAALAAARSAAAGRGDFGAVQASYAAQGQGFGAPGADTQSERVRDLAFGAPGTPGRKFAQRLVAAGMGDATTRRGQDIEAAQSKARLGMQAAGFDRANAGIDLDNAGKARIQAAQDAVVKAKTATERLAAAETLRVLTGRAEQPNRYTVVPGGQTVVDGQLVREPSRVLDNQSGEFVDAAAATPAPKYETGKVYADASGKRAKWDGAKFVAVN